MPDEFITVARVAKTQGRRGEVAADLFTDFPERFEERRHLSALLSDGKRRQLYLEQFWHHKGRMVFKFAGIDSIEDAEALIGSEIQIPAAQRAELEEGSVYISDLKGCVVTARSGNEPSRSLGKIDDVIFGAGEAPLLAIREGKKEYLVPFVEKFVEKMDLTRREIVLVVPEGMLELDAPLSREEKSRSHRGQQED
ncbi:MAG: ribosome maturation factor RimM [Acidobacteriaceae bacterium]